jgi:PAS domain S-box-containing protein
MCRNFFGWLNRRSKGSLVAGGLSLVFLVGLLDLVRPAHMSFASLYLIPILFVSWFVGKRPAIFIAVASVIVWSTINLMQYMPEEPFFVTCWNAMSRLGVFLVVVFLLHAIKAVNERLESDIEQRTAELAVKIAEHQHLESLLQTNEEIFRQLTGAIHEVFWMTSPDKSQVIYVSPAYETIWGRTCESNYASPNSWLEALHPEDRERVLKAAMTTQIDGKYDYEYRVVQPNGSIRWIHDRAFPVRDASGEVYRIAGIAQDITERKQAEAQLATLAHAVESTSELICITDLQDRFVFVNQAFQRVLGYTEAEILGKTPDILHSPRNPPELLAELRKETHLGGWRGEVLDRRKDGTEFWVRLSTSPIKDQLGKIIGLMGVAQDITERKQFAEAQQRQQTELQVLFDLIPAMIWFKDANNRILRLNKRAAETAGKSVEEIEGKSTGAIHPQEATKFYADDLEVIRSGVPKLGIVETLQNPEGKQIWVQTDKVPYCDKTGNVTGVVVVAHDITERKRAEARMTILAHAVESTSELICITDLQDRFTFVNRAFQQAYGYAEQEVLGQTPDILFSPKNPPTLIGQITEQTHSGGWQGEVLDRRKDGTEFPISLSTSRIMDESGDFIGLMGIARDITERTRNQEALRESEQRFRTAFGAAPVAMAIISENGRFLQVNRVLCEMLGYTEKEILAKTIRDVTHPSDLETTNRYIDRLLKRQRVSSLVEKRYLHKLGHVIWGQTTASLIHDKSGHPFYFIVHIQDFTERRRLEREILDISDREQARIGQDLHDGLCQQLVSAAFACNLLSKKLVAIGPAEADTASEIAGWIDEAISQARALARGLYPVKLEADGLTSALQELAEYVNDRFGITCVLENSEAVLITDNAVATHLYRIAQEAVINAVKHSKADRILIKLTSADGKISMCVQDDGIGIPEVITTGMGLHIMRYRTRMIGGALQIERDPSGGTTIVCSVQQETSKVDETDRL